MGVNISDIIDKKKTDLNELTNKVIAVDAYNTIYQFLASIRTDDGSPLTDKSGRPVSHLSGILGRNANLVKMGIKPIYVFDGEPPEFKQKTLKERKERKKRAAKDWLDALKEGDMEKARSKAQQTARITDEIIESAQELLTYLGIPIVQAPSEGEAQASFMSKNNDVWATASQDFDSILFGSPRLLRNLNMSGRRKLPRQNKYVNVEPEEIELDSVLSSLEITQEQLIDIGILIGTDYNPGIKGVGPKTALKLIRKHGDLRHILKELSVEIENYELIQNFFLKPPVTTDYILKWPQTNVEKVKKLLCDKHDFSEIRILKSLDMFTEFNKTSTQKTLDFF